jgi:hypothetical protein
MLNVANNQLYVNIPTGILKCESLAQLLLVGNKPTGGFP